MEEAFHAPVFSSHIVAGNLLSEDFEIVLSNSMKDDEGSYLFNRSSCRETDILCVRVTDVLYKISMKCNGKVRPSAFRGTKEGDSYQSWHEAVGISPPISFKNYEDCVRILRLLLKGSLYIFNVSLVSLRK